MGTILDEFDAVADKLQADFNRSTHLHHQNMKGVAREKALLDLLTEHLPGKFSLGSGTIVDVFGNESRTQDIVVYDGFNIPLLQKLSGDNVYFVEQVFAVIEVKSILTYPEVEDMMKKAVSVKSLRRGDSSKPGGVFVFGFAYRSPHTLEQIRDRIQAHVDREGQDWSIGAIAVLDDKNHQSGVLTNVSTHDIGTIMLDARDGGPIVAALTNGQGRMFLMFYLLLMEAIRVASSAVMMPDYLAYAHASGFGQVELQVGPLGRDRLLVQKKVAILRNAHDEADRDVVEAWRDIIEYSGRKVGELITESSVFSIGDHPLLGGPSPKEVWGASEKYLQGSATQDDLQGVNFLLGLLRSVSKDQTLKWGIDELPPGIAVLRRDQNSQIA